jgi:hypothetical protein
VADWLSAINAAKAKIARLIITIPVKSSNFEVFLFWFRSPSVLGRKARIPLAKDIWQPSSFAVQSIGGERGDKFRPTFTSWL